MGKYQTYKGNAENKLFYLVDNLVGGINTDFSDDASRDNEFKSLINFTVDKQGSLHKRLGFGKLTAISQIFNKFSDAPNVKYKSDAYPNPEIENDNIVYMKMLQNDNNCFRNLSAFIGDKAYRQYQDLYGSQNNQWKLLMITTNPLSEISNAWIFTCKLPALEYDASGKPTSKETIVTSLKKIDMPIVFSWDRNLANIETIEYFNKIYFTNNNKGLACFDRSNDTFTYYGSGVPNQENKAYKPSPMEIRKIGFNVLGDNPLYWVDYQGLTTDSIQGIYITTTNNIPVTSLPSGEKFRINILYTGSDSGFSISFKEGETDRGATVTANSSLSRTGLKVYDVAFSTQPTSNVEIKITKTNASIKDYYDYYDVNIVDKEAKAVQTLNIGSYGMVEMYNRAVYYKDDTIWFSEINNYSYVPNYNYVSLPIEPTDKITKIIFFRNVYIVFTKQRIYKMTGSFGDANFEVMPLNMSIGCHAPNTIVPIENVLYFASTRGLYELISSATYASNNMTFENVRELDTKVKGLTSDVTMYLGELIDPAVRYNGISERAYAIRYKDKYMLFFNTSYEKGDIAGLRNLDALTYQYDLKAFCTMRFPVKPTFLFMVDNAIEAFCTIPQKEYYTKEETLMEFDFTNQKASNGKFTDKTGHGYDATVVGGLVSYPGTGLTLNGNMKTGSINSGYNINTAGLKVNMDTNITSCNGKSLFDFRQTQQVAASSAESFTITTNWVAGYAGQMSFVITPDPYNLKAKVDWVFKWYRDNTSRNANQNGTFNLINTSDNTTLIGDTAFSFAFGSATVVSPKSGSFTINYDSSRNYSKAWKLSCSSQYPTYSSGTSWSNGGAVGFDKYQLATNGSSSSSLNKYYGIRLSGEARIIENGLCRVTCYPQLYLKNYASLYIGARTMKVWINGQEYSFSFDAISWNGKGDKLINPSGTSACTYDIRYDQDPGPTIGLDAQFDLRATISNVSYTNIDINGFTLGLPKSKSSTYSITTWNAVSMSGSGTITMKKLSNPSYRFITLSTVNGNTHQFSLKLENEYASTTQTITNNNKTITGRHTWSYNFTISGSNIIFIITEDGAEFGRVTFANTYFVNGERDNCNVLNGVPCSIYSYSAYAGSKLLMNYVFDEGTGTTLKDKSGNSKNATISGTYEWQVEKGLKFDGSSGYLALPKISKNVAFTNGFAVEFEAKFSDAKRACKIFDFATGFDTGASGTLKCSINGGKILNENTMVFQSTSVTRKSYKIMNNKANVTGKHKWKFNVVDNGKNYDIYLYLDGVLVDQTSNMYGGISNVDRSSNFIGKSNNVSDSLFAGMLYNFKVTINKSPNPVTLYESAMFEYDTTYNDFGQPMEIEIETKGMNLQYPMHQKKIKNLFVKGLGGYSYSEFFLEVYVDGHLINDPKKYRCTIDPITKQIIYDYTEDAALTFNEQQSLLGNIRLNYTRLGTTEYETKKIVLPSSKCKNVVVKIYGLSDDAVSIESLGFLFKLGKVKQS